MQKDIAAIFSINMHTLNLNFGSVLQSYALQKYLQKIGKDSIIVDYIPYHIQCRKQDRILSRMSKTKNIFKIKRFIKAHLSNVFFLIRYYKFQRFFLNNYKTTKHTYSHNDLLSINNIEGFNIDTFISGSDTVWKIDQTIGFNDVFFLNIPSSIGKCKISYAPSMGTRPFSEIEEQTFSHLISTFKGISTRDKTSTICAQKYTKQKVSLVVDPTLLLNEEDYLPITANVKEGNYVLVYTCEESDAIMVQEAQRLADEKGLRLIEITILRNVNLRAKHKIIYTAGVEDFLGYIRNADFIITNSFHGLCFSIIFKKNVYVFERDKTDTKIPDIMEMMNLQSHLVPCDDKQIKDFDQPVDYYQVYKKLDDAREISFDFLNSHIKI